MAYYHQPNTHSWSIVNASGQNNQPMDRQTVPELCHDRSDLPYSPERLQDDDETRGRRQQYIYIPSTSSISPGGIQQPPQLPGTAFLSPSLPPHASVSFTRPSDKKNPYSSHKAYPVQPDMRSPVEKDSYSSSSNGLVLDDATSAMYTSVNPFKSNMRRNSLPIAFEYSKDDSVTETSNHVIYPYPHRRTRFLVLLVEFLNLSFSFLLEYLPRQVYMHFLLRLPAFYWSRVARIFEEAEMTMPEIEKVALQAMGSITIERLHLTSPAGANLKVTWESFIDSLLREWKTLNIVSVLLLSAILTLLQIDAAGSDPITRNCALISLICALMSLLYGCIYIIRFASMRKPYKALEWAQMAQKTKTFIWWNVWVLLALPAVWLAWSILLYIACIMAFVWRSGTSGLESSLILSGRTELVIRIIVSVVLGIGVLHFFLIMNTLRRYGDSMDKQFKKELDRLVREKRRWRSRHSFDKAYRGYQKKYDEESASRSLSLEQKNESGWFKRAKVMEFRFQSRVNEVMPECLIDRGFTHEKWEKFITEAYSAWNGTSPKSGPFSGGSNPPRPQDIVSQLLERWNRKYFQPRSTLGVLCHEYIDLFPNSPRFAIYIVDVAPIDNEHILIAERFGSVPQGLSRIDIFDQLGHSGRSRIRGRTSIFSTRNPMDGRVRFPIHQENPTVPNYTYTRAQSTVGHPDPFQHNSVAPVSCRLSPSTDLRGQPMSTSYFEDRSNLHRGYYYDPIHNQRPGWTPGPYQYQPPLIRTPWSYELQPELMDMVNDSGTQSGQPPLSNVWSCHMPIRGTSQPQDLVTAEMSAYPPPVAESALGFQPHTSLGIPTEVSVLHEHSPGIPAPASNHDDDNVRRRSTSTSYRSFSSSPPRKRDIELVPADYPLRSSSPLRVYNRRPSLIQADARDSQQIDSIPNEVSHFERHYTLRSERTRFDPQEHAYMDKAGGLSSVQASWQPYTVSDSGVVGPWTMDYLSLRRILSPQSPWAQPHSE